METWTIPFPIGSMGLVYLPTCIMKKNQPNVGKYTSPMDPVGFEGNLPLIRRISTINQGTAQEMEGSLSCELCMQGTYQNQNLGDKHTCWVGCSTEPASIMFIAGKTHQNVNYKLLETIKSPSQFGEQGSTNQLYVLPPEN